MYDLNYLDMKNFRIVFSIVAATLFLTSCGDEKSLIGKWDDNIHLSTRKVTLSNKADSATITTKGTSWWIDSITIGDKTFGNSVGGTSTGTVLSEGDVTISRKTVNSLFVKVGENTTGSPRVVKISLESGDYFDGVTITQAGK